MFDWPVFIQGLYATKINLHGYDCVRVICMKYHYELLIEWDIVGPMSSIWRSERRHIQVMTIEICDIYKYVKFDHKCACEVIL